MGREEWDSQASIAFGAMCHGAVFKVLPSSGVTLINLRVNLGVESCTVEAHKRVCQRRALIQLCSR